MVILKLHCSRESGVPLLLFFPQSELSFRSTSLGSLKTIANSLLKSKQWLPSYKTLQQNLYKLDKKTVLPICFYFNLFNFCLARNTVEDLGKFVVPFIWGAKERDEKFLNERSNEKGKGQEHRRVTSPVEYLRKMFVNVGIVLFTCKKSYTLINQITLLIK